jgi:hypothetical protein
MNVNRFACLYPAINLRFTIYNPNNIVKFLSLAKKKARHTFKKTDDSRENFRCGRIVNC